MERIVEDLHKQLSAETIECKCADENQKVIRTTEHALKAALQNESRRYETLLPEKRVLAMVTALRGSNCESKSKSKKTRPTTIRGITNLGHVIESLRATDKSSEVSALQKKVWYRWKLDARNKDRHED
jgi:hypothetical protein